MVEPGSRYVIMIKYMLDKKTYVTSAALAEAAGVSVRTVKYDLKDLQGLLKVYGVGLLGKRSHGYRLCLGDDSDVAGLFGKLRANLGKKGGELYRYNFRRVITIINRLLLENRYEKIDELMDTFYIGRSALTLDLNRARTLLSKFRLEIDVNLRKGIGIMGNETDRRLCIAEYFFRCDDKLPVMVQREAVGGFGDWERLKGDMAFIVQEACRNNKIRLSPFVAMDLASHMYISVMRLKAGCGIEGLPGDLMVPGFNGDVYAAEEIGDKLEALCAVPIAKLERAYFALHIYSKKMPDGGLPGEEEHATLKQCVKEILQEIKDNFELDLGNDSVFLDFLYTNIGPMVFRLRTHLIVRNPLLFENLRRYLFATKVAHSASGIIEKLFGVQMDHNEFAYMVPAFHMAIGNHAKRKKFKIGFCGDLGLPETLLYYNELAERLPRDGYELVWIDRFHNAGYWNQLHYVIYADAFRPPFPIAWYEIREGDSVEAICDAIARYRLKQLRIDQYLKPEFAVFGLEGRNREAVMENLYLRLSERGLIAAQIDWKSAFRANEVGNKIVHIQDLGRILGKAGCYVFVLKTPILWEQDMVKLLIMIKTKRDGDGDLPLLCRIVTNWASSPDKVDHFLKSQSYEVFCEDIINECLKLCF